MWTGENFSVEMESVDKPFLVMAGKYDLPLFRLEIQQEHFPGFKNTEHFLILETPVFLAAKVEEFFA
jgi:pimeloyl-ACP methyl ester carboxylesterase